MKTATFKRLMQFVAMLTVVCVMPVATDPTITFTCTDNTITDITSPDKAAGFEILVKTETGDNFCVYQSGTFNCGGTHFVSKAALEVYIGKIVTQNSEKVIEGTQLYTYNLECTNPNDYSVTKSATAINVERPSTSAPPKSVTKIINPASLTLTVKKDDNTEISNSKVHVGQQLLLKMEVTDSFSLIPVSCEASSGSHSGYLLWEYKKDETNSEKCVIKDTTIMLKNKWQRISRGKKNEAKIGFQAFRFLDSASLTITCTAHICKKDHPEKCPDDCIEPGRKRRSVTPNRNVTTPTYSENASVTLQVTLDDNPNSSTCITARTPIVVMSCIVAFLARLFS